MTLAAPSVTTFMREAAVTNNGGPVVSGARLNFAGFASARYRGTRPPPALLTAISSAINRAVAGNPSQAAGACCFPKTVGGGYV